MDQKELTALITSLQHELKKEYVVLDGQDRPATFYQAPINSKHGDPCLVTQVEYKDGTSTIIVKSKETVGTWDSSYEI